MSGTEVNQGQEDWLQWVVSTRDDHIRTVRIQGHRTRCTQKAAGSPSKRETSLGRWHWLLRDVAWVMPRDNEELLF